MERSQRTKTIVAFVVNISVAIMEIVANAVGKMGKDPVVGATG